MGGMTASGGPGVARRGLMVGLVFALVMGGVGPSGATTLQDLFDDSDELDLPSDPPENDGAFTRNGLEFSNFKPALSSTLSSLPDFVSDILSPDNPIEQVLDSYSSLQVLELNDDANRQFSFGWLLDGNNGTAANAAGIGVTVLPDDLDTPGFDPGFHLESGNEWNVVGGNTGSVQLSAFEYTVTRNPSESKAITSADLRQFSDILDEDIGPDDAFSVALEPGDNPFDFTGWEWQVTSLPDAAAGLSLQLILDDQNPDDLSQALVNYTLDSGVRLEDIDLGPLEFIQDLLSVDLLPLLDCETPGICSSPLDQDYDWMGFGDRDSIRVVTIVALGATSGSQFTMDAMEQRIDPPPPGIPEPETALLLLAGLLGIGVARRRIQTG